MQRQIKSSKSKATIQKLADEILKFLADNEMLIDVRIFFNGRCYSTSDREGRNHRYGDITKIYTLEDMDVRNWIEYGPKDHILSMSFEGPFWHIMNDPGSYNWKKQEEFMAILAKYGLYYELGHTYTLSCYLK